MSTIDDMDPPRLEELAEAYVKRYDMEMRRLGATGETAPDEALNIVDEAMWSRWMRDFPLAGRSAKALLPGLKFTFEEMKARAREILAERRGDDPAPKEPKTSH